MSWITNQYHIRNFRYSDVTDAETNSSWAINWETCFVFWNKRWYYYDHWNATPIDWVKVLNANGWAGRWIYSNEVISAFQWNWDASWGLLPTTRTDWSDIQPWDEWYIDVAWDIAWLTPEQHLEIWDSLIARVGNPTVASDWFTLDWNKEKSTLQEAIEWIDDAHYMTPNKHVERIWLTDVGAITTLIDESNWNTGTYIWPAIPTFYKRQRYIDSTTWYIYEFDWTTIVRSKYTDKNRLVIDTTSNNPSVNNWEHIRVNTASWDAIVDLPDNTGGQISWTMVSIRKESTHDWKVIPSWFDWQLINHTVTKLHLAPERHIQYDNPTTKWMDNMHRFAKIWDKIYHTAGHQVGILEYDLTNQTVTQHQVITDLTAYMIITDWTNLYVSDWYAQRIYKIDPTTMSIIWTRTPPSGYRPWSPMAIADNGNLICSENHYARPSSNSRFYVKELRASDWVQVRTSANLWNTPTDIMVEQNHIYVVQVNAKRLYKLTSTLGTVWYISYATGSNHNFMTTDHQYIRLWPIGDWVGVKTFDIATWTMLPDMWTKWLSCPRRHFSQSRMYWTLRQSPNSHEAVRDYDLLTDTILKFYNIAPYRSSFAILDDVDDNYMYVNWMEQNIDWWSRWASFRLYKFWIGADSAAIELTQQFDQITLIANNDWWRDIHSFYAKQREDNSYDWSWTTTDNAPTDLYVNGATGQRIGIWEDTIVRVKTTVFAIDIVTQEANEYIKYCTVKNDWGTVSMLTNNHNEQDINEDDVSRQVDMVADDLLNSLRLVVRWDATNQVNRIAKSEVQVLSF